MNEIVRDRMAGMLYPEIAAKHGISKMKAIYHCRKAMWRGEVTPEQIGYKAKSKKPRQDPPFHKLYEKLTARMRIDENGCWIWTGPYYKNRPWPQNRYGHIGVKWPDGQWRTTGTHRAMMLAIHGFLTPDQVVCHRCDVPLCINPQHLFIGSMKDNIHDSRSKNRHHEGQKTHCVRGHPLTGPNVRVQIQVKKATGTKAMQRVCKLCALGRLRLKAGWPEDLAYSLPPQKPGTRPFTTGPSHNG